MFAYPIAIDGVSTRVLQAGFAGPPLVLVHGLGSRADRWTRNLDALAATGRRVFALDLPGHGFAGKGSGFDYSAGGYARFLAGFLEWLGEPKAAFVGTSFGALVVAAFAADWPERVSALALAGAVGVLPLGEARRAKTIAWLPDMSREGIRGRLRLGVVDQSLVTDELIEGDFRANNSPGAAESFAALARYYATGIDKDAPGARLAAAKRDYPVLLLWGEQDVASAPAIGAEIHRLLPGSRFETFAGAAHLPYLEQPERFHQLMRETLG